MLDYQKERVKLIQEILPLLGDTFVLKGGTALSLYYGLNRYSEDIDLDCKTNNMNFINKLKRHPDFKSWNIGIKKDTDTVFRIMLDYGASSNLGAYPLKIEVSNRNKNLLQSNTLKYKSINGVNVYEIGELVKMKAAAFSGRDKVRDLYDLNFLLTNYPHEFSEDTLLGIHQRITYMGEDELNLLLQEENNKHTLTAEDEIDFDGFTQNFINKVEKNIESIHNKEANPELEALRNGNYDKGLPSLPTLVRKPRPFRRR